MSETSQNIENVEPYKAEEYKKFIELVGRGEIPEHWEILAEALGINNNTITRWKRMPAFQKALNKGIDEALEQMKIVGRKDWKMWRERLSILRKESSAQVLQQFNVSGESVEFILDENQTT